jgi:hypothetical protein
MPFPNVISSVTPELIAFREFPVSFLRSHPYGKSAAFNIRLPYKEESVRNSSKIMRKIG